MDGHFECPFAECANDEHFLNLTDALGHLAEVHVPYIHRHSEPLGKGEEKHIWCCTECETEVHIHRRKWKFSSDFAMREHLQEHHGIIIPFSWSDEEIPNEHGEFAGELE